MGGGLIVYFDGGCPLCRREIAFYRRLRGAETITWLDLEESPIGGGRNPAADLSRCDALARFHARHPDGTLMRGAKAFSEVWRRLPLFRALYWLYRVPGMPWVMERAYDGFLKVRPRLVPRSVVE